MLVFKTKAINQVISYWPSFMSEVFCIGPRPSDSWQYRKNLTPVTGSIRNSEPVNGPIHDNLINNNFINQLEKKNSCIAHIC